MPMPTLDPSRFFAAVLADPSHKLPLPDRGGRHFSVEPDGEIVDSADPFYGHLLADGSLIRKPADVAETAPAATDAPKVLEPDAEPPAPVLPAEHAEPQA